MPEPKWKVGDPVIVKHARVTHHEAQSRISHETVTRVARKYFYTSEADAARWQVRAYEIETGRQKPQDPNYTNYLDHAYTPAQWEEKQLRDEVLDKIRELAKELDLDLSWRWSGKRNWSTARLMELQVLLDGVSADKEVTNLDDS